MVFLVMFWHDGMWRAMHNEYHGFDSAQDAVNEYRRGTDADMPFRIVQVVKEYR